MGLAASLVSFDVSVELGVFDIECRYPDSWLREITLSGRCYELIVARRGDR